MNKLRTHLNTLTLFAFIGAGLGALALYGGPLEQARAAERSLPRAEAFGALTLNAGQSARLNVVNAVLVQPEDATRGSDAAEHAPQTLILAFDLYAGEPPTDQSGARAVTRYRFLRRESHEVTLRPGESASYEFTAAEATRVNAIVIGPPDALGRPAFNDSNILTTLEVREDGRTIFIHPGALRAMIVCGASPDPR